MPLEIPTEVRTITEHLVGELRTTLADRLVAVYLFGSATTSAFEEGISDVDTVAVLTNDPTDQDISALRSMHDRLIEVAPAWKDRIEVDYLSARAMADFRGHPSPAARISPGEPFHRIRIDHQWILDWYQVLAAGHKLYGPPAEELIPAISQAEFADAVREQLAEWPARISTATRPGQVAHAVLTICRALRVCLTGENVSKKEAAAWAGERLPDFRQVIDDSVRWRYGTGSGATTQPDARAARELTETVLKICS